MIERLVLQFYRVFIVPSTLFLALVLGWPFSRKLREGLKMRLRRPGGGSPWFSLPARTRPIWFHCASGEFEFAKPVLREIKRQNPRLPILVTYFSPSYRQTIEGTPEVDMSCPLPWDLPGPVAAFLRHHEPRALLIARTDFWPELLWQVHRKGIPALAFSVTGGETLSKGLGRWWRTWLYGFLTAIDCVSAEEGQQISARLEAAGKNVTVSASGDTRYDQVIWRLSHGRATTVHDSRLFGPGDGLRLVLGSTWEADEAFLVPCLAEWVQSRRLRLIIAPHEPTIPHIMKLRQKLAAHGLSSQTLSESDASDTREAGTVLIIDRVGLLAELYAIADLAFVGGSFRKKVHSVMEPLAAGCPVVVGPFFKNSPEAMSFKEMPLTETALQMVNSVTTRADLEMALEKMSLTSPDQRQSARKSIQEEIKKRQGASRAVAEWALSQSDTSAERGTRAVGVIRNFEPSSLQG